MNESDPGLKTELHNAEVDLAYIRHFPPLEKYISLFKGSESENPETDEKRQRVWRDIEERMANGTLGRAWLVTDGLGIAERGDTKSTGDSKKTKFVKDKWGQKRRLDAADSQPDDKKANDGDDGGFFE